MTRLRIQQDRQHLRVPRSSTVQSPSRGLHNPNPAKTFPGRDESSHGKTKKYLTITEQACATSVYGAVSRELEGKGDVYLEEESVAERHCPPDGDAVEYGYSNRAYNQAKEESLWELSKTMVGVE